MDTKLDDVGIFIGLFIMLLMFTIACICLVLPKSITMHFTRKKNRMFVIPSAVPQESAEWPVAIAVPVGTQTQQKNDNNESKRKNQYGSFDSFNLGS